MSLVLTPKGSGEQMTVRVKSESTDTTYSLSAHFTGPVQATLHANAEVEANFTDISFKLNNLDELSDNKVDLFWLNNTATINTTHTFEKQPGGFRQAGRAAISVPLSTQHLVTTHYLYIQESTGNATVDLDSERFVQGSFKKILGKSARGLDLATTDIEVVNDRVPVGVQYIHEFDASGNTFVTVGPELDFFYSIIFARAKTQELLHRLNCLQICQTK
ncbi:hypothetical protein MSG28_012723 [Choristoneura fumiferana]|uniref:Uncharacterized protein n=1 Tax=Choristoneura fumiferana TaxID=7141 RepID=A0ACC0JHV7_CHOFU|nr:hypothetical protein MSG28_012723 [Choristoneura fumiferana]